MNKLRFTINALAVLVFTMAFASLAQAQATRTWVSGVGDDANPCSRTAPCKTFAGAISKTATGGEINALDPGGFGAVTITKAISIISQVEAGVLVSATNGIIINAPLGAKVLLQGLDIEGLGTGLNGVQILSASKVTIQNCSIRNFTGNGVNINGPAGGTRVVIADSFIYGNGGGVNVGTTGVTNVALLMRTVLDNNSSFATQVADTSVLFLSASKLLGSASAITAAAGAQVISFGDNVLQGTGLPTSTPGLK